MVLSGSYVRIGCLCGEERGNCEFFSDYCSIESLVEQEEVTVVYGPDVCSNPYRDLAPTPTPNTTTTSGIKKCQKIVIKSTAHDMYM